MAPGPLSFCSPIRGPCHTSPRSTKGVFISLLGPGVSLAPGTPAFLPASLKFPTATPTCPQFPEICAPLTHAVSSPQDQGQVLCSL